MNVVGSKLQTHKTRPKGSMATSKFILGDERGKMKENTVNVFCGLCI